MASPQLPGLQACEISDLTLDTATEPKEGGNGNTVAPHAALQNFDGFTFVHSPFEKIAC